MLPSGLQVRMEKQLGGHRVAPGRHGRRRHLCHKPCTVSGGGKSEISKSIADVILKGPVFVARLPPRLRAGRRNLDDGTFRPSTGSRSRRTLAPRPILSPERSLGSVIKLLTPSPRIHGRIQRLAATALPQTIRQLVFMVKRYYRPEWGDNWREHFSVDLINGFLGHELKFDNHKLRRATTCASASTATAPGASSSCARISIPPTRSRWRTTSPPRVVLPRESLNDLDPEVLEPQRQAGRQLRDACSSSGPTTPSIAGFDKQAEADIAGAGNFLSNYEPLDPRAGCGRMVEHVVEFDKYTEPMKQLADTIRRSSPRPSMSSPPRIRAWWTASRRRTRATCRSGPTW